ncbi:SpoIID/LytB domain-containing protein [Neobacillus sp. Marseille-QA0830]
MKKPLHLLMVFTIIVSLLPFTNVQAQQIEPVVKVKLINYLGNKTAIVLKSNGDYITNDSNVVLKSGTIYELKQINGKLSLYKDGILLGSYNTLSAQPVDSRSQLSINDRSYLGSFDFTVEINQYVRPINSVYMEDYLKGVVPIEMYPSWNIGALKSQAVAARTYAMKYTNGGIIDDTISFQVYGGYIWTPSTTKAVDETKGQVLLYNGRLIDTVYSASNGGMTENNANAWGNTLVPYLSIRQDNYDPVTPWSFSFNKTQIDLNGKDLSKSSEWWTTVKEADTAITNNIKVWLYSNGYANSEIKIVSIPDFSLYDIGTGGRVNKASMTVNFLVKDITDPTSKLIPQQITFKDTSAAKVRSIIGNRVMLSYLVDQVDTATDKVNVKGRGDGHGVGMSQWGAKNMGDAGKTYEDILKFYYTGVSILTMYEVSDKTTSPATMTEVKNPVTEIPVLPSPVQDTTAPVLKDVANSMDYTTKKASLTYSFNENALVTTFVRDASGTVIQYLEQDVEKAPGKYTVNWDTTSIPDGDYSFGIITKDAAGNKSSAASKFTLVKPDTTAPVLKDVASSIDYSKKKASVSYSFNENAFVTTFVRDANGTIIQYLEQDAVKAPDEYTVDWDTTSVPDGDYSFGVITRDAAGNKSSSASMFTLLKPDTTAPILKDVSSSYNNTTKKASVTFSFNENAFVTVYVRNANGTIIQYLEKDAAKAPGKYTFDWDVTSMANGDYSFGIISKDPAGNTSSAASKITLNKTLTGTINATNVYIRQNASTSSKVLGTLQKKTVTVFTKTGSWYYIQYGSIIGYVYSPYVSNVR